MFDPEEEDQPRKEIDWDAWEKNRFTGWRRWWMLITVITMAAMVGLWFQSGGEFLPWGPPR